MSRGHRIAKTTNYHKFPISYVKQNSQNNCKKYSSDNHLLACKFYNIFWHMQAKMCIFVPGTPKTKK